MNRCMIVVPSDVQSRLEVIRVPQSRPNTLRTLHVRLGGRVTSLLVSVEMFGRTETFAMIINRDRAHRGLVANVESGNASVEGVLVNRVATALAFSDDEVMSGRVAIYGPVILAGEGVEGSSWTPISQGRAEEVLPHLHRLRRASVQVLQQA